jgi:glycosyltransferase involved in cell wall biosynthesis
MKTKPLRILHLNASSAGGAFVAAQRLNEALNKLDGVESEHWVFDGLEGDFHLWANTWLRKKWAVGLHALEKLDFLRFEASRKVRFAFSHGKTGINLNNWDAIQNADIIHLHWINKGFVSLNGLEHLMGMGKKIVWTCHDMWPFTGGCYHPRGCEHFHRGCGNCQYLKHPHASDLSFQVFQKKKRIFTAVAKELQFVTPSEWLKHQAEQSGMLKLDVAQSGNSIGNHSQSEMAHKEMAQTEEFNHEHPGIPKIQVIPNPIDTDFFRPISQPESIRFEETVDAPIVLMFAAANLGNPAKGFAEFRLICNGLVERGLSQFKALIVGENRLPQGDLGLKCEVEALGFISDANEMRDIYRRADIYVTTSHEENLPTTIMESLSCGVPVAAFAVGGIPEMISVEAENRTGWLAKKLDVDALIQDIEKYAQMGTAERNQIKANCRVSAIAKYGSEAVAKQYLQVYRA